MLANQSHQVLGLALAGIFLAISLWGLGAWIVNRDPGKGFWRLLAIGQAGLGLQVLVGSIVLFSRGNRDVLHYVYGGFGILVLVFVHSTAKRMKGLEWAAFAAVSFFIFGLQLRGYVTGSNPP